MPLPLIVAGVAAVGSIGGAIISSGAQKSAANTAAAAQQQATDSQLQLGRENMAFQQGIYDKNTALLNPFVQRGNTAGNSINALLGLGGSQPVAATPQAAPYPGFPYADPTQRAPTPAQPPYPGFPYAQQPSFQQSQTASPYTQQPMNNAGDIGGFDGGEPGGAHPNGIMAMLNGVAKQRMLQTGQLPPQQQSATPAPATTGTIPAGQTAQQASTDAFNQFANSAGMQFQLHQGENAINNGYAAKGQLQSGAALKALQGYGQSTALNNYFLPYMGLLQGQQATGAQAGSAIAGVGSNFGNTVSSIYGQQSNAIQNGADATSNAALLRGQANSNMWNTVGSSLGNFASSFVPQPSYGGGGSFGYSGSRY